MLSRTALAGLLFAASGLAHAGFMPFTASVNGVSQILEVVDLSGPVVRVQTLAFGNGSPGALTYRSGDTINLGSGQGSGTNSFTTDDGDELFGSFTVQLVPGADPSLFDLIGEVLFTGGTGDFLGASGFASFFAKGQFVSEFEATTRFEFKGRVSTVPEPGSTGLSLLGLLALAIGHGPGRFRRLTGSGLRRSTTTALALCDPYTARASDGRPLAGGAPNPHPHTHPAPTGTAAPAAACTPHAARARAAPLQLAPASPWSRWASAHAATAREWVQPLDA